MSSIVLTPDQTLAKQAILDFLISDDPCFVLAGYAGTGKTTIIRDVMETYYTKTKLMQLIDPNYDAMPWLFSATTNKAAEALSQATELETYTVHSLLGLIVSTNYDTGENRLVRKRGATDLENTILVIDECSYIDPTLLSYILKSVVNCKIIFMGDPSQLTPVKRSDVPVFTQGYPTFSLTQSVRQDVNSPIHGICAGLRDTILRNADFPKIQLSPTVRRLNKADFDAAILQEFTRPDWKQSDSKVLAWRNKTVQYYNMNIFEHLNQRSEFKPGDYVVNNHYVQGIKTDAELVISHVQEAVELQVEGYDVKFTNQKSLFIPKDSKHYLKAKKHYINEGDSTAVQHIMETWGDIRPAYACTINKSQGSTYQTVFIDLGDLACCRVPNQVARLLYVAISRAKTNIIFTGDLR